jgi:UDP-glucose 4-epimerase
MKVLVTGGAGYIGSVVVEQLLAANHQVVVYDNLSKGHAEMVPSAARFIRADLADRSTLLATLRTEGIEVVVHLAADSIVPESVAHPAKYYANNLAAGLVLLDSMREAGVSRLVFSSTAAVYGDSAAQPILENQPTDPGNPYGETKLALERACQWYAQAYGLKFTSLRYFNAAGASERCGEMHDPETHLIPLLLRVAMGEQSHVELFGDDYPTSDGTCVRDYVHVIDLARAHILAIPKLGECSTVLNLGSGTGHTVREVIEAAEQVTGRKIAVRIAARRPGDPAVLVASYDRIQKELGWSPANGALRHIIQTAWDWTRRRTASHSPA